MHALFVPGLIGTVSAGWTSVRTKDLAYSLQFVTAVIVLAAGGIQFWFATQ